MARLVLRGQRKGVRKEACGWTMGAAASGEVPGPHMNSEARAGPSASGADALSGLSGAGRGPAGQGQPILPETGVNSSQSALVPLPESMPQNVTLFGGRSLQR